MIPYWYCTVQYTYGTPGLPWGVRLLPVPVIPVLYTYSIGVSMHVYHRYIPVPSRGHSTNNVFVWSVTSYVAWQHPSSQTPNRRTKLFNSSVVLNAVIISNIPSQLSLGITCQRRDEEWYHLLDSCNMYPSTHVLFMFCPYEFGFVDTACTSVWWFVPIETTVRHQQATWGEKSAISFKIHLFNLSSGIVDVAKCGGWRSRCPDHQGGYYKWPRNYFPNCYCAWSADNGSSR